MYIHGSKKRNIGVKLDRSASELGAVHSHVIFRFSTHFRYFRYGYETAVWCQRYELFCNEKERRNKAKELIALMDGAVTIHYR